MVYHKRVIIHHQSDPLISVPACLLNDPALWGKAGKYAPHALAIPWYQFCIQQFLTRDWFSSHMSQSMDQSGLRTNTDIKSRQRHFTESAIVCIVRFKPLSNLAVSHYIHWESLIWVGKHTPICSLIVVSWRMQRKITSIEWNLHAISSYNIMVSVAMRQSHQQFSQDISAKSICNFVWTKWNFIGTCHNAYIYIYICVCVYSPNKYQPFGRNICTRTTPAHQVDIKNN